jgi:hypothetical protein
MPRYPIAT